MFGSFWLAKPEKVPSILVLALGISETTHVVVTMRLSALSRRRQPLAIPLPDVPGHHFARDNVVAGWRFGGEANEDVEQIPGELILGLLL